MHERAHAPDAREGGGDIGLLGYDCVHAIPVLMADGLEYGRHVGDGSRGRW